MKVGFHLDTSSTVKKTIENVLLNDGALEIVYSKLVVQVYWISLDYMIDLKTDNIPGG